MRSFGRNVRRPKIALIWFTIRVCSVTRLARSRFGRLASSSSSNRLRCRAGVFYGGKDGVRIDAGARAATAFLLELIARLQAEATVPMIDIRAYAKFLKGYGCYSSAQSRPSVASLGSGGSRDRTKSPAKVSQKWEYCRIGPETFREIDRPKRKNGKVETAANRESRPLAGFPDGPGVVQPNTGLGGWGGRDRTLQ